ncbi:DUF4136 domain-containing protein [Comamonas thiooxydans]|uniref:DUF4136 domain-containing protein n=1 Tax=Comamonas thiooxydans TaxID=363952 RepID=A0A0E3BUF4_9BURK|nr:DUF4136 domain-containing protein [Comamonas thiooxydans]KGH11549.1 hypothetical protein P608_13205 [Comamonas thiooxydans]KGH21152.1 hypothetical protein P607_08610 [Comamonas thiooxydans]KGH24560.1 hypothetical protein P606_08510 [Comamonas thiooxydans]
MNLRKTSLRWIGLAALTATALLAGCSTVREVNSTVQSFSALNTIPVPATYRLETLPSQQGQVNFAAVEAQAQHALARVGLTRDDSHASLVVQISAMARYARDWASWPYYDPYWGPRWGWGMSYGRGFGWGFGGGMMFNEPPLEYYRAVSIVMRDIKTQQIVYETSAQRQDVWTDDPAIFGILFDAALTGFPKPPQGQRNVRTVIQPPAAPAQPAASVTPAAPAKVAPATVAPAR